MISPPVWRAKRFGSLKNSGRLLLFALATIASGATMGAFWGTLGSILLNQSSVLITWIWIAIGLISIVYGAGESRRAKWWVPSRHWLVPRHLGKYGSPAFEVIFGLFLGPGFFTMIPFIGYHLLVLACIAAGDGWNGALVMAVFGAARSMPVLLTPILYAVRRRRYTHEMAAEVNTWFDRFDQKMLLIRVAALSSATGMSLASIF